MRSAPQPDPITAAKPRQRLAVIGGGPAGLTAAYQWAKGGGDVVVLEMSDLVGGISRTESTNGYRFDIGGHRFFTKVVEVEALWHEILGDEFIKVPRLSRIYYRGRYYDYPLKLANAMRNLGAYESVRILLSYVKWQLWPSSEEESFEQWVQNRFGGRLYWHFFRTYTEKVWGIPCTEIRADWAAQRIKSLSLSKAVLNALLKSKSHGTSTLISEFDYPRLGPGQMWEACRDKIVDMGGEVRMNSRVIEVRHEGAGTVQSLLVESGEGEQYTLEADAFINTMPIGELTRRMTPEAPPEALQAAGGLKYRDFLIVALQIEGRDPFPDNWIYIHSPEVKVGRIQNFRSWSRAMVPSDGASSLGLEYFCHKGDGLWQSDDADLIDLARRELEQLKLFDQDSRVVDGVVIRQPKAYPVYDTEYRGHLGVLRDYFERFNNFYTVGRNGMHRYNNQDHSMLSAMLAIQNLQHGAEHDVWDVNVERSYHEDFQRGERGNGNPRGSNEASATTSQPPPADRSPPPTDSVVARAE
ncbi:MAG: NAD(P)/FAD-dependent oxidoreductase [Planctomycetota bacterium]